jgi:hypothetical protein
MTQAFVYVWTHLPSMMWYVGSHTAKDCHPNDGYICHSKKIKPLIIANPTEWKRTVVQLGQPEDMVLLESTIQRLFDAKNDPRSFNQHNGDGKFRYKGGKKPPKKKVVCRLVDRKEMDLGNFSQWAERQDNPEKYKLRDTLMGQTKQGRPAHNKGKVSPLKGKSNGRKGIKNPKLSIALKGKPSANKGKPSTQRGIPKPGVSSALKGVPKPHISLALKGVPKQKVVCRLQDKKEMDIQNYTKWIKKEIVL